MASLAGSKGADCKKTFEKYMPKSSTEQDCCSFIKKIKKIKKSNSFSNKCTS